MTKTRPTPRLATINMINFARRFRVATTGLADVLTPSQVRAFSDCELRWFYEHLLGLPDPPTAMQALDRAIRTALMANFRHKLDAKEDLRTEGVVGLFRRAWEQQQDLAVFCNDQSPESLACTGEALIRLYMQEAAPSIQPESIEQLFEGVLGSVRIRGQIDVVDVDGTIIDIVTVASLPARIDPMHRFELGTCARLVYGASGIVRSDILVASSPAQHLTRPGKPWQQTIAGWMNYFLWPRRRCVAATTCPTGTGPAAVDTRAPTGVAVSRTSAAWWNRKTAGGVTAGAWPITASATRWAFTNGALPFCSGTRMIFFPPGR
jgi:RecB family exonuclease